MVQTTPTAASSSASSPSPFKKPVFRGVVDPAPSDVGVREGIAPSAFSSSNDEGCGLGSGGGLAPPTSTASSDCAGGAFHPFLPRPQRVVSAVATPSSSSTTSSPTTIIFREAAFDWAATTTAEEQEEFGGALRSPLLLQRANPIREGNVDEDDVGSEERSRSGSRSSSRSRRRPRDDTEDEDEMEYSSHDGRSTTSRTRRRTRSAAMRIVVGEQDGLEELYHPCQEGPYFQPFVSLENVLRKLPSSSGRSDTFGAAAHVPASAVAPTTLLLPRRQPWDDAYDDHHDDDVAPMDAAPEGGSGFRWQPRRHHADDEGMDENESENARGVGGGQHPMVDYSRFFEADLYNDRIVLLCDSHVNDEGEDDGGEDDDLWRGPNHDDDLWRGPNHEIGLPPGGVGVAALTDVVGIDDIDNDDVDDDFSLSSEEASSILDDPALVGGNGGVARSDAFWDEGLEGFPVGASPP